MILCHTSGSEQVSAVGVSAGCPLVLLAPSLWTTAGLAASIPSPCTMGNGAALLIGAMLGTGRSRAESGFPLLPYGKRSGWEMQLETPGLMALSRRQLWHRRINTGTFICVAPFWWVYWNFKIMCLIHHFNNWQSERDSPVKVVH